MRNIFSHVFNYQLMFTVVNRINNIYTQLADVQHVDVLLGSSAGVGEEDGSAINAEFTYRRKTLNALQIKHLV